MSQTILDEYIAEFDKTGVQPDPTKYGFSDMLNMLVEASCVMENLGESANRNKALKAENAKLTYQLAEKVVNKNTEVLQDVINDQHTEIERLRAELAQQWQPVDVEITCSCGDPECTSELAAVDGGSFIEIVGNGLSLGCDLGEYRICRKVQHD